MSRTILFVENREKTYFWAAVAQILIGRGHRIEWLVQNPMFTPTGAGEVHVLPFPGKNELAGDEESLSSFGAVVTDRGRQYFHAGSRHYSYYRDRIAALLRRRAPALIIGESTLFHELLTIEAAATAEAVYLHPAAGRYPNDRFFLFRGLSQDPYVGSGDLGDSAWKRTLVQAIAHGNETPAYMAAPPLRELLRRRAKRTLAGWRVWIGRVRGERYNTPSLRTKAALTLATMGNARKWNRMAALPPGHARAILYPLQLQPESNIDVWGRPWSDQSVVIRSMLEAAPDDVVIAVKANPWLKYETSDDLLALAEEESRVVLLPREMNMQAAQARTIGAVTVSGTVGFEAVIGRGRCVSLRHPIIDRLFPWCSASTPQDAVAKLLHEPAAGVGNPDEGEKLLTELQRQSFPGLIGDSIWAPECLDRANLELVADAIEVGWRQAMRSHDQHNSAA